ncbi:glycine dehydrogenase subunit 1 [compost metagenome]
MNFDAAGLSVKDINKRLLALGIFGGKDLTQDFPALGASALYCVTEIHTQADIQRLTAALKKVIAQ